MSEDKDLVAYVGNKAIIVNKEGSVLLIKETYDGKWGLPGGRMQKSEQGNTLEHCLRREVSEELGEDLKYQVGNIVDTTWRRFVSKSGEERWVFIVCFLCKYIRGEVKIQEEEVLEYRWTSIEDYLEYEYVYGYKKVLDNYFLQKNNLVEFMSDQNPGGAATPRP